MFYVSVSYLMPNVILQVFSRSVVAIFQMMFNVVQFVESDTTRRYAVDLFKDLLLQAKLQQYLVRYKSLDNYYFSNTTYLYHVG